MSRRPESEQSKGLTTQPSPLTIGKRIKVVASLSDLDKHDNHTLVDNTLILGYGTEIIRRYGTDVSEGLRTKAFTASGDYTPVTITITL